ncbi:Rad17 cell cycle checkpoint protein-domain-containing protein [Melampsora americana]|nr:Rad17 cell cycle checkpoint protein-domain-containing protein [Melampsora americana]
MPSSSSSTKRPLSINSTSIEKPSQESKSERQSKRQKPLSQHDFFQSFPISLNSNQNHHHQPKTKSNQHPKFIVDHLSDHEDDEILIRSVSDSSSSSFNKIKKSNSTSTSNHPIDLSHQSNTSSTLKSVNQPSTESETSLWSEKYTPNKPSDLAVHPKKIQLIHGWLKEAFTASSSIKKYRRLLILGGPAGSGKSAIIRALSSQPVEDQSNRKPIPTSHRNGKGKAKSEVEIQPLGYEILEWQESCGDPTSLNFSRLSEFPIWLTRASFGPTLLFDDSEGPSSIEPSNHSKASQSGISSQTTQTHKLLLVDELPNLHHDQTLSAFCEALKLHLNSTRPSTPPLVVIISDTTVRPGQEGADNVLSNQTHLGHRGGRYNLEEKGMNARSLLSNEILQHPSCCYIKLNSVNKTIMKKMLSRVLEEDEGFRKISSSVKRKKLGIKELDEIIDLANGDIRAALNNLQFSFINPSVGRPTRVSKFKLQDQDSVSTRGNRSENFLGSRESSLVLFHGLGKVLYNKRWGDDPVEDAKDKRFRPTKPEDVPDFLKEFSRRQLKTDIEALYSDSGINIDYFIGYLFQNYLGFVNQIEEIEILMEYISFANSELNLNLENWNQNPICSLYQFHITIRGILIGLPSPVQRNQVKQSLKKSEYWERNKKSVENSKDLEAFRVSEIVLSSQKSRFLDHGILESDSLGRLELDEEVGCFSRQF